MKLLHLYYNFFSRYFYGCKPDKEIKLVCTVYTVAMVAAVITMFFVSIQF